MSFAKSLTGLTDFWGSDRWIREHCITRNDDQLEWDLFTNKVDKVQAEGYS